MFRLYECTFHALVILSWPVLVNLCHLIGSFVNFFFFVNSVSLTLLSGQFSFFLLFIMQNV